ncbi:MAG: cysteine hydrolase family protein [Nitrospinota bacterium]
MPREPLMTLEEKLNPEWTALVCIDYQNDFCAKGGALDKCGFDVAPMAGIAHTLGRFIDEVRDAGIPILWVRNIYATDQGWYLSDVTQSQSKRTLQGLHHDVKLCEKDTWGWDYFGEVRPKEGDCEIFKHRYNAFIDTDLPLILRGRGIRTLIICGVTTNVCVESTTRHAYFLDYYCVVPDDCVSAYGDGLHEMSLKNIDFLFGEVAGSDKIIKALAANAKAQPAGHA